jgi:hypothetical protein
MKETNPFKVEKGYWVLCLSYFPNVEETLNISIKISKNPEEGKETNLKDAKDKNKASDHFGYPKGMIVSMITSVKINNEPHYHDVKLQSLI